MFLQFPHIHKFVFYTSLIVFPHFFLFFLHQNEKGDDIGCYIWGYRALINTNMYNDILYQFVSKFVGWFGWVSYRFVSFGQPIVMLHFAIQLVPYAVTNLHIHIYARMYIGTFICNCSFNLYYFILNIMLNFINSITI